MGMKRSRRRFGRWCRRLFRCLPAKGVKELDGSVVVPEEPCPSPVAVDSALPRITLKKSESEPSCGGGQYKTFGQVTRERLFDEMLRGTESEDTWKVLILDKVTAKIMKCSWTMTDNTEFRVLLVEDLSENRQRWPNHDAIYFIQPLRENVDRLLSDMSRSDPLYRKAYVFFSSPLSMDLVAHIKKATSLLPHLGGLTEMNLEYFAIDSQAFVTDNERALEELYSENADGSQKYDDCLNTMATRIATVFASLREYPCVRYRAAKISLDVSTVTAACDSIPKKLAASVLDRLYRYQHKISDFPKEETCDLLILDRSVDQIAPVIHEWTYDAMFHDLLNIEGNKYVHEVPITGLATEKKEVFLDSQDPLWLELRHAHIAEASECLHKKMTFFMSKNKAAQYQKSREHVDLSIWNLKRVVHNLPQYFEQIDKLSLHVEIVEKVHKLVSEMRLKEIGQLEQDLVFEDAGREELITFFTENQDVTPEIRMRLLMIYASIHPEKFEGGKGRMLMQLARLSPNNMNAVNNMRNLVGSDSRKRSGSFALKFGILENKHVARKERKNEETWQLSRFYPMIEELIEKLEKDELPKDEYPCMQKSNPTARCVRSRRTATWAVPCYPDNESSSNSVLRHASSDFKRMGPRIFIFIVGGATRSELRVAHKLTSKIKREIILGSTSLDDPHQYITKMKLLGADL